MRYPRSWVSLLPVSGLWLLAATLCGQQTVLPETSWREWTAANQIWLQGQVIPNRKVLNIRPGRGCCSNLVTNAGGRLELGYL